MSFLAALNAGMNCVQVVYWTGCLQTHHSRMFVLSAETLSPQLPPFLVDSLMRPVLSGAFQEE